MIEEKMLPFSKEKKKIEEMTFSNLALTVECKRATGKMKTMGLGYYSVVLNLPKTSSLMASPHQNLNSFCPEKCYVKLILFPN